MLVDGTSGNTPLPAVVSVRFVNFPNAIHTFFSHKNRFHKCHITEFKPCPQARVYFISILEDLRMQYTTCIRGELQYIRVCICCLLS